MANINVRTVPSNTNVTVQDGNNITASVSGGNEINLTVTPTPRQIVQINRGVAGPSGNDNIGGYPVHLDGTPQNYDALMFVSSQWVNVNQLEIADGGNY
jgi:hypothetical protein